MGERVSGRVGDVQFASLIKSPRLPVSPSTTLVALEDEHGAGEHGHGDHAEHDVHVPVTYSGDWYPLGQFGKLKITIGYYIDALTVLMFAMVTFIATCIHFYANGYKESQGRFKTGYKVGTWKRWNFEGVAKPDRYYPDEDFKKTNRTSRPAKFPGGMAALQTLVNDSLQYPAEARERKLEGTVYITFTIDATGEVSHPQISDGVHYLLDEEALRFVSSLPTWTPASKNGMPVDSNYIMPIVFDLGGESSLPSTPENNNTKN